MYRIQDFIRPCTFDEPNDNITILPVIINPRFHATKTFAVPACGYCILVRAKKSSTKNKNVKPLA